MISLEREADRAGCTDQEFRARLDASGIGIAGHGPMWESAVRALADRLAKLRREARAQ